MKPIDKLKPTGPTPVEEMCTCNGTGPIMLRSALGPFPVYCMSCNGEVPLETLTLSDELAEGIAYWRDIHDAMYVLWLSSGEYEDWARQKLLDPKGSINVQGMALARQLNDQRQTYFWYFSDTGLEDVPTPRACPFCGQQLEEYENRNYQVCQACQVAV